MSRLFRFFLLLLLIFSAIAAGVILQRHHVPSMIKRVLRGLPLEPQAPSMQVLNWNSRYRTAPRHSLDGLTLDAIEANRPLYLESLKDVLKLSHFPLQFRSSVEVVETLKIDKSLTRQKILIETEPGMRIPFYLFLPDSPSALPLILVLHGHSAGKIETAGLMDSYQNGNALALAKAGFVTAAPDFRGFGELGWEGDWDDALGHAYGRNIHVQDVVMNLQQGRTTLGAYLYDLQQILAYLKTRPEIDRHRIGAAGSSMGADVALWFSIFSPSVKAVFASHAPVFSYPWVPDYQTSRHVCIQTLPGLQDIIPYEEIPLLTAPKPLFAAYNDEDHASVNRARLEWLYKTSGFADRLSFDVHEGGENFDNAKAAAWFKKWLA